MRYYIIKEKDRTCPQTTFQENLLKQLTKWREAGDRLIVCMDMKEHNYNKSLTGLSPLLRVWGCKWW